MQVVDLISGQVFFFLFKQKTRSIQAAKQEVHKKDRQLIITNRLEHSEGKTILLATLF